LISGVCQAKDVPREHRAQHSLSNSREDFERGNSMYNACRDCNAGFVTRAPHRVA
jgi:hypothetical protein